MDRLEMSETDKEGELNKAPLTQIEEVRELELTLKTMWSEVLQIK